ncbi:unnamed protein product, partial [Cladocopium goreaui]
VEGKDGLRRFGTVLEVDAEKGGKTVKLDLEASDPDEEESPAKEKTPEEKPAEEFAFVVDGDFEKIRVEYFLKTTKPGDEIQGFKLEKSMPMAPVGITGFKERKTAHKEGVKDWYRLDVVKTLNAALAKTSWDDEATHFGHVDPGGHGGSHWLDQENLTFYFINGTVIALSESRDLLDSGQAGTGCTHRLVPEAHITFKGKVSDEIKKFEVREDNENPKIEDLGLGLAFSAGVRCGWVLSVEDTLSEDNTGIQPKISKEELVANPEKLLEMENVTLVLECEEPEQSCDVEMYSENFYNYDIESNFCTVQFETDGDGCSYPERRWGVLCLVVPKDFEPKEGELKWKWLTSDDVGEDVKDLPILKEASTSAAKVGTLSPSDDHIKIIKEVEVEDSTFLQLADGQWIPIFQEDEDGNKTSVLAKVEPWDEVMAGASEILNHAEGVADANPLVSREGWDEERLRALCMRHGWEFEWMSEDGERRRRGAERQGLVAMPFATTKSDTQCPDGFETKSS